MMEGRKKAGRPVSWVRGRKGWRNKRSGEEEASIVRLVGWAVVSMCVKKASLVTSA